jgi:hypothetical protein
LTSDELNILVAELKPWEKHRDYFLYREFVTELNERAPAIPKPKLSRSMEGNPEFYWGPNVFTMFPGYVELELYPVKGDRVMVGYTLGHFNGSNVEGAWDRTNNYFDCWVILGMLHTFEEKVT